MSTDRHASMLHNQFSCLLISPFVVLTLCSHTKKCGPCDFVESPQKRFEYGIAESEEQIRQYPADRLDEAEKIIVNPNQVPKPIRKSAREWYENYRKRYKEARLMIFGDSWAHLMLIHGTFKEVLVDRGYPENYYGGGVAWIGTKAHQWVNVPYVPYIAIKHAPKLEVVALSLGGNDFVEVWRKENENNPDPNQRNSARIEKIAENVDKVVRDIREMNPKIHVVVIGYDYTNFINSTQLTGLAKVNGNYLRKLYGNREGQFNCLVRYKPADCLPGFLNGSLPSTAPDQADLNRAWLELGRQIRDKVEGRNNGGPKGRTWASYVNNFGLMQRLYGDQSSGDKCRYDPEVIPLPNSTFNVTDSKTGCPSPVQSMNQIPGFIDAIHLSRRGYYHLAQNAMDQVICEKLTAPLQDRKTLEKNFPRAGNKLVCDEGTGRKGCPCRIEYDKDFFTKNPICKE